MLRSQGEPRMIVEQIKEFANRQERFPQIQLRMGAAMYHAVPRLHRSNDRLAQWFRAPPPSIDRRYHRELRQDVQYELVEWGRREIFNERLHVWHKERN